MFYILLTFNQFFNQIYIKMIKAEIYFDGKYYCARCLDIDVFTQGKTIDDLKEAVSLHLEDKNLPETSVLAMMEFEIVTIQRV